MKLLVAVFVLLIVGVVVTFGILGAKSRSASPPGPVDGKLQPCPSRPNCVCSEFPDALDHFLSPITFDGRSTEQMLQDIQTTIRKMQGVIVAQQPDYIAATFVSKTFKFVDDFEIRIDAAQSQLHLRSASRVGYSDQDVNRRRSEQFAQLIQGVSKNRSAAEGNQE